MQARPTHITTIASFTTKGKNMKKIFLLLLTLPFAPRAFSESLEWNCVANGFYSPTCEAGTPYCAGESMKFQARSRVELNAPITSYFSSRAEALQNVIATCEKAGWGTCRLEKCEDSRGNSLKTETYRSGAFSPTGGHQTSGNVELIERQGEIYLRLAENFDSQKGPDLRVVLRDSQLNRAMEVVAPLQSFKGAQEYKLNLSPGQISDFDQAVIYCAKFHVDFAIATLK